jgi:hypothetical protein
MELARMSIVRARLVEWHEEPADQSDITDLVSWQ